MEKKSSINAKTTGQKLGGMESSVSPQTIRKKIFKIEKYSKQYP